jgi:hypothetical protein
MGAGNVRLRDSGRARRAAGVKEPTCSVPGRSVRPTAGQSRPGRRSDDGQTILPRLRRNLECPADQVFAWIVRRIRTPGPLRASRRQVPPDDNQASLAPPKIRPHGTRRCRDALTLAARHELHLVEVPVSTSGANSSASASARPHPSAAQLLAAKNTRPSKSLDDLAADIFGSDEEL